MLLTVIFSLFLVLIIVLFRNLREFGIIPSDTRTWWKAGLSLAAVTAVGLIVAKVLHSTDKVR